MKQFKFDDLSDRQKVAVIVLGGVFLFGIAILMISGQADDLFFVLLIAAAMIITSVIVAMNKAKEPREEHHPAPADNDHSDQGASAQFVNHVVPVRLVKKSKGGVFSFFGAAMTTVLWALLALTDMAQETTFVSAVQSGFITNPLNLIAIAALLSVFGWMFHDATCNLLAATALVGVVLVDLTGVFVLVPAIFLVIAYARMKPAYTLEIGKTQE